MKTFKMSLLVCIALVTSVATGKPLHSEGHLFMKQIPLSQSVNKKNNKLNLFALVDDEDYEWINQWKWSAGEGRGLFYAERMSVDDITGKKRIQKMHKLIAGALGPDLLVDHKDRNTLNNQKNNLRICTRLDNSANTSSRKNSSSKYLGVSWYPIGKKWRAQIQRSGVKIHLGSFKCEIDAAIAYNKKAAELFGEFANLNIIEEQPTEPQSPYTLF